MAISSDWKRDAVSPVLLEAKELHERNAQMGECLMCDGTGWHYQVTTGDNAERVECRFCALADARKPVPEEIPSPTVVKFTSLDKDGFHTYRLSMPPDEYDRMVDELEIAGGWDRYVGGWGNSRDAWRMRAEAAEADVSRLKAQAAEDVALLKRRAAAIDSLKADLADAEADRDIWKMRCERKEAQLKEAHGFASAASAPKDHKNQRDAALQRAVQQTTWRPE